MALPPVKVDYRRGSGELIRPLRTMGLPAVRKTLACADVVFQIHGPRGPCKVAIERKKVSELLGHESISRFNGRQLPKLVKRYGQTGFVIVIIEGCTTIDRRSACLMQGTREAGYGQRTLYETWKKRLLTMSLKGRVIIEPTHGIVETLHLIHAIYRWGQVPWAKHKSHYAVNSQPADVAILDERTMRRQTFAQWPGVGWVYSARVSKHFGSVREAACATEDEWMRALHIAKGRKRVRRLVQFLQGKEDRDGKGN